MSGDERLRNGCQASDNGNSNERVLCKGLELVSGVAWLRNGCLASDHGNFEQCVFLTGSASGHISSKLNITGTQVGCH